jgi:hypothetical protein
LRKTPSHSAVIKRPLAARPEAGAARWRGRRLVPAAAAGVLFAGAFGVGMATKSSSSPQTATSLASPVPIHAPRISVPALERDAPIPALRARPRPVSRHPASRSATAINSTTPVAPSRGPSAPPASPPVIQSPPSRVIHGQSGGVVQSSAGGGSVVHGGN